MLQVKKKMEEVEFCRNVRGVNDGKDFPKELLSHIYHSICSGEQALTLWVQ
jgi:brefeldin A-resistance guanine nucleotide exchange factor 1